MKILNKIALFSFVTASLTACTKGIEYEEVPMEIQNEVGLDLTGPTKGANVSARELFLGKVWEVNYGGKYVDLLRTVDAKKSVLVSSVYEAGAPEDSVYVVNITVSDSVVYETPNKGYLFDQSKFAGEAVQPLFIDPVEGRSTKIKLPVDLKRLVVGIVLKNDKACYVNRVGDAPELGIPSDFTTPHRYIVENENDRNGLGKRQRLYEIRITSVH